MNAKNWLAKVALFLVVGVSGCNFCMKSSDCSDGQMCSEEKECVDPPRKESTSTPTPSSKPAATPAPAPRSACSICSDACRGISGCSCCHECGGFCFN